MSVLAQAQASSAPSLVLEVVIPVYNEEIALPLAVSGLTQHLARFPWTWQITIADNASTDATPVVASRLARDHEGVRVVTLPEKGRGRALKRVWQASDAELLAYMDVDLSTDLNALLPLLAPLLSGHSDLAIGTRLSRSSRVTRGPKRELISRGYNVLLRSTLRTRFSDAQCGFKAIRRDVAEVLLPLVEDDTWFFDTELLVLAERAGMRIHEIPVDWVDDPDSRVDVVSTALDDLRGMRRLGWSLLTGRVPLGVVRAQLGTARDGGRAGAQLALFAGIGVISTMAYALIYLASRQVLPAQVGNLVALGVTAVANTAANRRITFGVTGSGALRHQAQGLLVLGVGLTLTSGSLWLLGEVTPSAPHSAEVAVLTVANLVTTASRFLAMRLWIFRDRAAPGCATDRDLSGDVRTSPPRRSRLTR